MNSAFWIAQARGSTKVQQQVARVFPQMFFFWFSRNFLLTAFVKNWLKAQAWKGINVIVFYCFSFIWRQKTCFNSQFQNSQLAPINLWLQLTTETSTTAVSAAGEKKEVFRGVSVKIDSFLWLNFTFSALEDVRNNVRESTKATIPKDCRMTEKWKSQVSMPLANFNSFRCAIKKSVFQI